MIRIEPGANQAIAGLNNTHSLQTGRGHRSDSGSAIINPSKGDAVTATVARGRFAFAQMQQINERMNGAAAGIRRDDQRMAKVNQALAQMKAELFQIVKIYPPYAPGDPERVKFLRSFNGLRRQLDSMTIPPPDKWSDPTPGEYAPATEEVSVGTGGEAAPSRDFAPPVPRYGNIPALPDAADDIEIRTTINRIDDAMTTVAGRREQLAEQASVIGRNWGQDARIDELRRNSRETWDFPVPGEHEAEDASGEAGREVAAIPGAMAPGMQPQMAELLR